MKRIFRNAIFLLVSLALSLSAARAQQEKGANPFSVFPLEGNGQNIISGGGKATVKNHKTITGHDGTQALAFSITEKNYGDYIRNIVYPINISPDKFNQLTITLWAKVENCYRKMFIIGNGPDKYNRGLIVDTHDDMYRWGMNCGKDGILYGPPATNEWTFIALIYDNKNQAARMIINNEVFSSRGTSHNVDEKVFTGAMNGGIDDVRFFDHTLSAEEIEAVSGIKLTAGTDNLAIKDRYSYKEKRKQEEANKIKVGEVYVVHNKEFRVNNSTDYKVTSAVLTEGDTFRIVSKEKDSWYKIAYRQGKTGFTTRGTINKDAHLQGESAFMHKLAYGFQHIFDFTKLTSWIIVVVFTIILFFVKKYFIRLDAFLLRLRKGGDEYADGGGKNDTSSERPNFLRRIYPVKRMQWYPLLTGMLLGATIFIGSFWDSYEMEWFYNEGFNLLPIGYDRPVHWFLYAMSMITILLTISWIIESFVVAGPWIGLLRAFILLILNFMSLMVTFFLLVLVAIVIAVMIALWIFGSAAGSGSYKCPSCGRTFSASAGSSVSCPGCGASLST
jgi:hypothetical protein